MFGNAMDPKYLVMGFTGLMVVSLVFGIVGE